MMALFLWHAIYFSLPDVATAAVVVQTQCDIHSFPATACATGHHCGSNHFCMSCTIFGAQCTQCSSSGCESGGCPQGSHIDMSSGSAMCLACQSGRSCQNGQSCPSGQYCASHCGDTCQACSDGGVKAASRSGEELSSLSAGTQFVPYVWQGSDWYPVCGHYFRDSSNGATAFCKRLGFTSGQIYFTQETYEKDSMPIGNCNVGQVLASCSGGGNAWGDLEWNNGACKAGLHIGVNVSCSGVAAETKTSACTSQFCPAHCAVCKSYSGGDYCHTCESGYGPTGYYTGSLKTKEICQSCPAHCTVCEAHSDGEYCHTCEKGYGPSGYYSGSHKKQEICQACPNNCPTCSGSSCGQGCYKHSAGQCEVCSGGLTSYKTCRNMCAGYAWDSSSSMCKACSTVDAVLCETECKGHAFTGSKCKMCLVGFPCGSVSGPGCPSGHYCARDHCCLAL